MSPICLALKPRGDVTRQKGGIRVTRSLKIVIVFVIKYLHGNKFAKILNFRLPLLEKQNHLFINGPLFFVTNLSFFFKSLQENNL